MGSVVTYPAAVVGNTTIKTIFDFGARNAGGDDVAAFQAAASSGEAVLVPNTGTDWLISTYLDMASGSQLIGLGVPTVIVTGSQRFFRGHTVTDVVVEGFDVEVQGGVSDSVGVLINCENCTVRNNTFRECGFYLVLQGTSTGCVVENNEFTGSICGIEVLDAYENTIRGNHVTDSTGFGIWITGTANRNLIEGNWTTSNGIELIGVTRSAWGNRIIGNHAEGCGDNGISVTGYNNVVASNTCVGNYLSGIYIFGRHNSVIGNICKNNGQIYATTSAQYAGIDVRGLSGGTGQYNTVIGNVCDDDQNSKTQYFGIRIGVGYTAHAAGQTIAIGDYRSNALKLYKATTAGTSGASSPTHTTGTASDGVVTWEFVDTFYDYAEPARNNITGNIIHRAVSSLLVDQSTNKLNTIITDAGVIWKQAAIASQAIPSTIRNVFVGQNTPEAIQTGSTGDIFLRSNGNYGLGPLYVKHGDASNTGWLPVMTRLFGATAQRPSNVSIAAYTGFPYFDQTLAKPIWWNGSNWVDATGATV